MAILVTGGAGYIGSHATLELIDAGETPVVLDDLSTGFDWAVPAGTPLIVGDVGDQALLREIILRHDITEIIHFAAKIIVEDSVSDPLGYYLANAEKSRSLIEVAVASGVRRFIFSSTAAVYGEPSQNPVTEVATLNPVSPYGRSKLMVEWILADAARAHGLDYVVLRYFNVAGADPLGRSGESTAHATHLVKIAAQAAVGKRAGMKVFGTDYPTPDGSCLRDYVQVSDLARAHIDALRHLRADGGNLVANCGYAKGFSVLEVIAAVKRICGIDFPVEIAERRAGDPAAIVAGNARARETLGWTPRFDNLDEIVRQAVDWERQLATRGL